MRLMGSSWVRFWALQAALWLIVRSCLQEGCSAPPRNRDELVQSPQRKDKAAVLLQLSNFRGRSDCPFGLNCSSVKMNVTASLSLSSAMPSASDSWQWQGQKEVLLNEMFTFWDAFRDPLTGLYCDSLYFGDSNSCGEDNNLYSSAATGMGLIADCVFAELGLLSRSVANERALQTINSFIQSWPRENFSGFFVHFTSRSFEAETEFSTVDTAEMAMGALFAGNYLGGVVQVAATKLASMTSWEDAIKSATEPTIWPVVNSTTGEFSGLIKPFNEYFIVAYIGKLYDSRKASSYFENYFATASDLPPKGYGGYPVQRSYKHYDLETDQPALYMSSFIPQFCFFQTSYFSKSPYYAQKLFPAWLKADMKYWDESLDGSSEIWGQKVDGKVFGSGAGPSPLGYEANQIKNNPDLVFSAPIMAGFLPAADSVTREEINLKLVWLYENDICAYTKQLPGSKQAKVLWRCSIKKPEWRATSADSIDFSTMVLGFAFNFLPAGFYEAYAA
mmetsp:Transcript_12012/g.18967  ORF Transcript_12012/g.18967 Transcript_12012/m.18967 type:complete len:504 (+) Transcript_12012:122-1633(+)